MFEMPRKASQLQRGDEVFRNVSGEFSMLFAPLIILDLPVLSATVHVLVIFTLSTLAFISAGLLSERPLAAPKGKAEIAERVRGQNAGRFPVDHPENGGWIDENRSSASFLRLNRSLK